MAFTSPWYEQFSGNSFIASDKEKRMLVNSQAIDLFVVFAVVFIASSVSIFKWYFTYLHVLINPMYLEFIACTELFRSGRSGQNISFAVPRCFPVCLHSKVFSVAQFPYHVLEF